MRYQSTLGLDDAQVEELVRRIEQVLQTRPRPLMMPKILDLEEQVMIVLLLVRQNLSRMLVADLLGVSQPTISRVYRAVMPLLDQATCINEPDFEEVSANRTTIVDGTDVPTRNRKDVGKDNYSGKRHRQGLNIQVAATTSGSLLGVSTPVPGCRHDRRAITECGWEALLDRRDASEAVVAVVGHHRTGTWVEPRFRFGGKRGSECWVSRAWATEYRDGPRIRQRSASVKATNTP